MRSGDGKAGVMAGDVTSGSHVQRKVGVKEEMRYEEGCGVSQRISGNSGRQLMGAVA